MRRKEQLHHSVTEGTIEDRRHQTHQTIRTQPTGKKDVEINSYA